MYCSCGKTIDQERIDFLIEFNKPMICTACSNEQKRVGLMDFAHKTAPELILLPNDEEQKRLAFRIFKRSR